ncbi:MAG: class I SAM-dependent methyltransferase [Bacteroidetes bacterium]|nr:class I SAM-dependent methyltransferase [Bacteroidota bacterium]
MSNQDGQIENFWNQNPVGSNFVEYESGKAFYEEYDRFRYRTEGHILSELDEIDFMGKKVLEIGLGQGADSMQIINRGALYYGIDLTDESVKRLKERFALFNLPFQDIRKSNAQNIPYSDGFFDIVYSHGVIHHSPDIEIIVSEIYRVLKNGGLGVIMLYHKQSINYYLSIGLLRRMGLLLIVLFPFTIKWIGRMTGEGVERIDRHRENLKTFGWRYLLMRNFLHRSTDGPDNIYSSVWSKKSSRSLFKEFKKIRFKVHFLNERHLLGLQKILPRSFKNKLATWFGWHLWVFMEK